MNVAERTNCYAAVEKVYYEQREWADKSKPRPRFEDVYPASVFAPRAENDLRLETALGILRGKPLTAAEVQGEIDRMIAHSRDPATLQKIFAALGDDPQRVAECVAQPALVERLVRGAYADSATLHADERVAALRGYAQVQAGAGAIASSARVEAAWTAADAAQLAVDTLDAPRFDARRRGSTTRLQQRFEGVAAELGMPADAENLQRMLGFTSPLREHGEDFAALRVERGANGMEVESYIWSKRPFDEWWRDTAALVAPSSRALAGTFTLASVASGQCTIGEWIGPTKAVNDYQTRDSQYTDAVWTGSEMMLYGAGYYAYSGDFSSTAPRTEGGLRFNASGNAWSVMSSAGQPVNNGYPNGIVEWRSAWTGTQLIVMGCPFSDSGGISCAWAGARYSPATDSWTSINATGAIAGKYYYDSSLRLYWAGGKVLVWRVGGFYKPTAPGNPLPPALSSYDPVADVWQTLADPPQTDAGNGDAPIMGDSAVWDGTELIAVGHSGCIRANQFCYSDHLSSEIYIYNLASNQWRQVTNYAPTLSDRVFANVAWTGTEVIVWGGDVPVDDGTGTNTVGMPTNTGARYKPSTGTWTAMSTTNAPVARDYPVARWTGTIGKFVVWGGQVPPPPGVNAPDAFPQTGAMYSPASNSWTTMRNTGAPLGRYAGLSVWTGTEVIVWGGQACTADNTTFADCNNGGRFNASTNNWSPLLARGPDGAPGNSYWYSIGMASSGSDSLVFGDRQSYSGSQTLTDGSLYRPATDDWTPIGTTGAPSARQDAYLGWGGGKYFAWGGTDHSLGTPLHDGALYDPVTQTWSPMAEPTIDMSQRTGYEHAAGTYFYLWGGYSYATSGGVNDGIVYDPATNAWTALPSANAPSARCQALSTTDSNGNFVLWGGYDCASTWPSTGAVYNHATNAWTPLAASGSVPANTTYGDFYDGGFGVSHLGVLNGGDIFLWDARAASGWRYAFGSNAWQSISAAGAPPAMYYGGQAMQVAGRDVVFFGGDTRAQNSGVASAVQGYAYRPEADAWSQLPLDRAPSARTGAYMGVIGSELMVWGGSTYTGYGGGPGITNTGALYCYDNRSGALSADLAVSGHFAPATIATSMPATLVVQVTNTGPDTATGVGFTSDTTQDFAFTSIVTADTNCTVPAAGTSGAITCQLGSLNSGASKSVTFALSPFAAGTYNLPISTTANEPDPVMANNSASMPITVIDDLVFFSGFEN